MLQPVIKKSLFVLALALAVLSVAHVALAFANTITTGAASNIGLYAATISGTYTLDSSRSVNTYFVWGRTPEINLTTGRTSEVTQPAQEQGTLSAQLTGLDPDTTYYFQASVNYGYTIGHGEIKSFKTLPLSGSGSNGEQPRPQPVPTEEGGLVLCKENCGYSEAIAMIQGIIDFLLYVLAMPIAAVMFAYAGFIYMKSGGADKAKAKTIFWNVFIGLAIALAAWLIVNTVINSLLSEEARTDGGYNLLTQ